MKQATRTVLSISAEGWHLRVCRTCCVAGRWGGTWTCILPLHHPVISPALNLLESWMACESLPFLVLGLWEADGSQPATFDFLGRDRDRARAPRVSMLEWLEDSCSSNRIIIIKNLAYCCACC